MKYDNLMIDCETLGVSSTPVLLSIGLVAFNFDSKVEEMTATEILVNIESCIAAGLKVDASTFLWWMNQSKVARDAIIQGQESAVDLNDACRKLDEFCREYLMPGSSGSRVWSYGSTADILWLRNVYEKIGREVPWQYRQERCMRTIIAELGYENDWVNYGTAHRAVDDAIAQALTLSNVMNRVD